VIAACLFILSGFAPLFAAPRPAGAQPPPPAYRLVADFDVSAREVKGTAAIDIPAGVSLTLNTSGLVLEEARLDGTPLPAEAVSEERLRVDPAASGQRLEIRYRKAADPDNRIEDNGIAMTGLWHPRPDIPCLFSLRATIPDGMSAVTETDGIDILDGGAVIDSRFSRGTTAIHFIAGPYEVAKTPMRSGRGEIYSYFFKEDASLAQRYRRKAADYIQRYEDMLGPFPYRRFSIVENRRPTGYAMPTFTLLGSAVVRLPFIVDTSLGHEVLHSWFGNAIGVEAGSGNWCEGLTTYLADQAYAADAGEGSRFRKDEMLKYHNYVHGDAAVPVADFTGAGLEGGPQLKARRAVGYGKTAMIFHMLRRKIGDDAFFRALRAIVHDYTGRAASWTDIKEAFAAETDIGLDTFFDQWLTRADIPDIRAKDFKISRRDGQIRLSLTLEQRTDPPYDLDVPVTVRTDSGELRETARLTGKEATLTFSLDAPPRLLAIDPDYDVMRVPANDEIPPAWSWFEGAAAKLAVVNSSADYDLYEPFVSYLEGIGADVLAADEVTDDDLIDKAVVFLGLSGHVPRSLFARPDHPRTGLTIDVRRNPLNPALPMVLVSAANREETAAALKRLGHYGRYGYLHFEAGHAKDKRILQGENGVLYGFGAPPQGVASRRAMALPEIIRRLRHSRVVYVGEAHTRYADHLLQLAVIRGLRRLRPDIAIGMEMFPASAQEALDDYINGEIDEKTFIKRSNYFTVWSYDYRLYRDIMQFARKYRIPVIGLNIDKKIVNKVYRQGGAAALAPEEVMGLPVDRDLDMPGYRRRVESVYNLHPGRDAAKTARFAGFLQAQAIWDETMASNVAAYITSHPQAVMVVLAGRGHILKEQAIPPRVERRVDVPQSVVIAADGGELYPPEADYVVFMPPEQLPPRALMGIVMEKGGEEGPGVRVKEVKKGSPAAKAGVEPGDILLAIDGEAVGSLDDVKIAMLSRRKGDSVRITVRRDGFFSSGERTLTLTL